MKISISAGDFPETYNLDKALKVIKDLNVNYVEVIYGKDILYKDNITSFKNILSSKNLKISSVDNWCVFTKKEMNVNIVRIGPFGGVENGILTKEVLKEYKNGILPCLKEAEKNKVYLVLENEFYDDPCQSALQTLEILKYMDSEYFRLLYDPCNYYIAGEEPFPYTYDIVKKYIKYIHIKDAMKIKEWEKAEVSERGRKEANCYLDKAGNTIWKHKKNDYLCLALGEGGCNYDGLLKQLKKDKYEGFLSIEPHVREEIHTETLKKNITYMQERGGKIL